MVYVSFLLSVESVLFVLVILKTLHCVKSYRISLFPMPHQSLMEDSDGNMNPELQRRDRYLLHSTPVPITHWHNVILVPAREKSWPRNSKWYLVAFSHSLTGLVSVIKYSCLYFLVTKNGNITPLGRLITIKISYIFLQFMQRWCH